MAKSPEMEAFLEKLTKDLFGQDRTRQPIQRPEYRVFNVEGQQHLDVSKKIHYRCPTCGREFDPALEFRDDLSRKEFGISRMCQPCQDSVFQAPDETEDGT